MTTTLGGPRLDDPALFRDQLFIDGEWTAGSGEPTPVLRSGHR